MEHRARQILQAYGRLYPQAWARVDEARQAASLPGWPPWCFAPIAITLGLVAERIGAEAALSPNGALDAAALSALAPWRLTQGVYRFDEALLRPLLRTTLRKVPVEALYHLPEWSVYIEAPPPDLMSDAARHDLEGLRGFWVYLDYDPRPETPDTELRLLLDFEQDPATLLERMQQGIPPRLSPMTFPLISGDLEESLRALGRGTAVAQHNQQHMDRLLRRYGMGQREAEALRERVIETCSPLIAMALYLCAEEPDLTRDGAPATPALPEPKRTRRRGLRHFPPAAPRRWDVGVRLGAALRRLAGTGPDEPSPAPAGEGRRRASPRPHVRRAHWHTYRVGPGRRDVRLRWLPPIPVRLDRPEALPTTIRPVQGAGPEEADG